MTWEAAFDLTSLILILIGALLCLTAAIGLLRFRDVPTRLHAATKPQVLGLILICIAIALALYHFNRLPSVNARCADADRSPHRQCRRTC